MQVFTFELREVVLGARTLSPDLAQQLHQLVAALRDSCGQIHAEEKGVLLALPEGVCVRREDFHPSQNELVYQFDEIGDRWQIRGVDGMVERDQRVQVVIELPADELGALVG